MKLLKANYKEVKGTRNTKVELEDFLRSFVETGEKCMLVQNHKYKTAMSGANTMTRVIDRLHIHVKVFIRKGNIYLENLDI